MFANRHKYLNETCLIAGEDKEDANNDMSNSSGKLLVCVCVCFFSSSCIKQHHFLFFLIGDESENSTSCDSRSNSELPPQWIEVNEKNVVAEEQFTAAYRHVKNAKAMRDYLNGKIKKSKDRH